MNHKTRLKLFRIKGKINMKINRFKSLLPALIFIPLLIITLLSPVGMVVYTGKFYWLYGLLISWIPISYVLIWCRVMKKIFK
mgnify:CR=1 FL=1